MGAGAALIVVGSLLPWVRTGGRARNSYDLFRIVGRLGFGPDGPASIAMRWWPLVPLLTVAASVVAWWGWPRPGGALGIAAALYAGGVALAVIAAPDRTGVGLEAGVGLTAAGSAVLLAGSVAAVVVGSRRALRPATDRDG